MDDLQKLISEYQIKYIQHDKIQSEREKLEKLIFQNEKEISLASEELREARSKMLQKIHEDSLKENI